MEINHRFSILNSRDLEELHPWGGGLDRLLAAMPMVIFLINYAEGGVRTYTGIGGDVEAVTGWPISHFQTLGDWVALRAPEAPHLSTSHKEARVAKYGNDYQLRFKQTSGEWQWLRVCERWLKIEPDGAGVFAGYLVNINEQKAAEERLVITERLAALGEMSQGLAHELRQPLATISLAAENIQTSLSKGDIDGARRRLQRIASQVQRADSIIEQLRRFALQGKQKAPLEPVNINKALDNILPMVETKLRLSEIVLKKELSDAAANLVMADAVALEQILVNLILNAVDSINASKNKHTGIISVSTHHSSVTGKVDIEVADNGSGIVASVLPKLFEPFVTTKGPNGGMGLGLSLCHSLVTAMGGTIVARNTDDGAIFTITLDRADSGAD